MNEGQRVSVLLVDDSAEDADLVLLELRRAGFTVHCRQVDSAAGMTAALGETVWDVILCDYAMPQFSPFEALAMRNQRSPQTPFLIVSGGILDEAALSLMREGARDIVLKENLWRLPAAVRRELQDKAVREAAERAASEAEAQLAAVLRSIRDAFFACDHEWRFTYVNPKAAELLGKGRQELFGVSIWEALPDAGSGAFSTELHRVAAEGKHRQFEEFSPRLSRWFDIDAYPFLGGVSVILRDITRRKQMEQALRESEERFARFMQNLPGAAWMKDARGRYVYANTTAEQIFHTPLPQLRGKTDDEVFSPETAAQFKANDQAVILSGRPLQTMELLPQEDGVHESVVNKFPILNPDGSLALVGGVAIDITEQRRAEAAARKWEEIFTRAAFGVAVANPRDDTLEAVNPAFARMHGYTVEELVGRPLADTFAPEFRSELPMHARLAHERGHHVYESIHVRKDGTRFPVLADVTSFKNDRGEALFRAAYFQDITARRMAEEALRDSEESYRVLAETAGDGIVKIDESSRILFVNTAAGEIFGYRSDELLGQSVTMLMPDYLRELHCAAVDRYLNSGERHISWTGVELMGLHRDGREVPLEISFGEFVKDGARVFTGIIRDVTARKEAQKRLAAQHAVTRILSEHSSLSEIAPRTLQALGECLGWSMGAVWTVDHQARVLRCAHTWNRSGGITAFEARTRERTFEAGTGLPGRVWKNRRPAWIPDVTKDANFPRAPYARQEGLHAAFGFPILLGSEVLGVMEFFSRQIQEPDVDLLRMVEVIGGQIAQFLERKRLESQVRHAQKLESLGILAGGVAHDFNNLLVGILGNASLVVETLSPAHPAQSMLEGIIAASERAANLTRQMLAYSGKGRFVVEPIDVSELVREMAGLLHVSIPKHVLLRHDLAANLPAVEADVAQLQQLVMNLVINGAEAIGERPGSVTLSTSLREVDSQHIDAVLAGANIVPGQYVYLSVQDTGHGMDEETMQKIFDPFFTTKFTGRGLGLAAALGIVRGHRGALKVYSTPGQGTVFDVLFPALSGEVPAKAAPERAEELAGSGMILVVDDEEIVRRTAQTTLERYGYTVLAAENGEEAIETFRRLRNGIELVLLDLSMPVMGGEECLRRLRLLNPAVPVILSSGFNEVEAIRHFAEQGLAGFIQKPYTGRQLAEKVRSVLALGRRNV